VYRNWFCLLDYIHTSSFWTVMFHYPMLTAYWTVHLVTVFQALHKRTPGARGWRRSTHILNSSSRYKWVDSFTLRSPYSWEESPMNALNWRSW
jgi:hypothetical protein